MKDQLNKIPLPESNSLEPTESFHAYLGLDWGDQSHAYALADPQGVQEGEIVHSAESLHKFLDELEQRFQGRSVAVGLESSRGVVVSALMDRPWITIFPIHSTTSSRYRRAFTPSGAKDDLPDARVCLDLVTHHREKLRPLLVQDEATVELKLLCELRRGQVDDRTKFNNRLKSRLKNYYPQALELTGSLLYSPISLDFLSRWPDVLALKKAQPQTLRKFYHSHNVRRPEVVKRRLDLVSKAVPLSQDLITTRVSVIEVKILITQLRQLNRAVSEIDSQIKVAFNDHQDRDLFADLPGAGAVLGPRLLIAFGSDRSQFPDAASVAKALGVAPVTEKSGKREWIHWRWNAPIFMRQSLVEWAGQTAKHCPWSKAYYQHQKKSGKDHHVILRALAYKWIRILWKCWKDRTPYNQERYLKSLERRGSQYAVAATLPAV